MQTAATSGRPRPPPYRNRQPSPPGPSPTTPGKAFHGQRHGQRTCSANPENPGPAPEIEDVKQQTKTAKETASE